MSDRERRQHPRLPASSLSGRLGFNQPLRLVDLSEQGARLETTEWLAPGRRYAFRLGEPALHLSAVVARCALIKVDDGSGRGPVYDAGLTFVGLSPKMRQQLAGLLAALAAAAGEPTLPLVRPA